ncbi:MAG TPA: hypothetical protein VGL71_12605 [Urbifossiella sp.]|jgi:hypothetical protein
MPNRVHFLQQKFIAILPRINLHARIYFRHLTSEDAKDEASAETIALSWKWFIRLVQRGKRPETFASAIAAYAALAVKRGRRLCGQTKAKDVMSSRAQRQGDFVVKPLPDASISEEIVFEALQANTTTPVPDQVIFRIDFPEWLLTRSARDRKIIEKLMAGERSAQMARRLGISESRISQLRNEYSKDWRSFCGESAN